MNGVAEIAFGVANAPAGIWDKQEEIIRSVAILCSKAMIERDLVKNNTGRHLVQQYLNL